MNGSDFGMTEQEFETAVTEVRPWVNGIFEQGGYPAIEAEFIRLDALVKNGNASGVEQYRRMVLSNILVMA